MKVSSYIKIKKSANEVLNLIKSPNNLEKFLLDSEKKLKALKDLYVQDLISKRVYIEKTDKIAKIVINWSYSHSNSSKTPGGAAPF